MERKGNLNNSKSCFILGLPEAGKTSYLSALSYSLEQSQNHSKLHLHRYTGNQQYLARLANVWANADRVSRTYSENQQNNIEVCLENDSNEIFTAIFPDLSGETFQKQYLEREIDPVFAESIKKCNGILLFINPENIVKPELIVNLSLRFRSVESDESQGNDLSEEYSATKRASTDVQLVLLLQDVLYLRKHKACTLIIVVSAWDTVQPLGMNPRDFVSKETPLLWQFVESNKNVYETSFYGVSAQGGSYDEIPAEELIERYIDNPTDRILVVDENGELSHDITLPLWKALEDIPENYHD